MGKQKTHGLHDALARMVEPSFGRTTRSVQYWATQAGISPSALYMKCQGERAITVTELVALTKATGDDALLQAIAMETGHCVLRVADKLRLFDVDACEQIATTCREQAEAISAICGAVKDGIVTDDERAQIERELIEMSSETAKLRQMVMEMPRRGAAKKLQVL